jgi:NADH-quinone oxidoreductase subunit M
MLFLIFVLRTYFYFDRASDGFGSIRHHSFQGVFITDLVLGLDGLSLVLLVLTAFIFPTCYILCRSIGDTCSPVAFGLFVLFVLAMEMLLLLIFQFLDLFFFYFSFEAILIPMYMLIGK